MDDTVLTLIRGEMPESPDRFWAEVSYRISRGDRATWQAVTACLAVADFLCLLGTGRRSAQPWRYFGLPYPGLGTTMWEAYGGTA